jgi:hypothetical protein
MAAEGMLQVVKANAAQPCAYCQARCTQAGAARVQSSATGAYRAV